MFLRVKNQTWFLLITVGVIALLVGGKPDNETDWTDQFDRKYAIYALDLPQQIDFAGEPVPLKDYDIRERLDREILVNTYFQSQTLLLIKRANRWFPVIEPILKKNGIPDDFKYLALAESGYTQAGSPKGAVGFWQFTEATAKTYGLEINDEVDERYHVEKSTSAACLFLLESYGIYKSWTMAAASYNIGRHNLNSQIARQKVNNYYDLLLNDETSRYIFRVLALKTILQDPVRYGFHLRADDLYPVIRYKEVSVDSSVTDFASFARSMGINYKILKIHNPWLRDNHLTNPQKKSYLIKIPLEGYGEHEFNYQLDMDSVRINGKDTEIKPIGE